MGLHSHHPLAVFWEQQGLQTFGPEPEVIAACRAARDAGALARIEALVNEDTNNLYAVLVASWLMR